MTLAAHVVSGVWSRLHPTRLAAATAWASQRGERLVSLGCGCRHCDLVIPMPAGRLSVAAATLGRWCSEMIGPDGMLIAWDEESAAVAAETSQPIGVMLDGLAGGAAARTVAMVLADRHASLLAASPAVQRVLGVDGVQAVPMAAWPPRERGERPLDASLHVHLAGEPMNADHCRSLVPLLGKLRLLGRSVSIRIAGTPERVMHVVDMLASLGVTDVRCGPPGILEADLRRGDLVWCGGVVSGSQLVQPVCPALAAWAAGGVVLLPAEHPAEALLGNLGDVILNVDTQSDAAVRRLDACIASARSSDRSGRASQWVESLEAVLASAVSCGPMPA